MRMDLVGMGVAGQGFQQIAATMQLRIIKPELRVQSCNQAHFLKNFGIAGER